MATGSGLQNINRRNIRLHYSGTRGNKGGLYLLYALSYKPVQ